MIIVKAIFDDNNTAKPENIPDTKHGSHFDGTNYFYFESESEKIAFYADLNQNQ